MQFEPRKTESHRNWTDPDGIKIYTISAKGQTVDQSQYLPRLSAIKQAKGISWASTPAFVIFHDGAGARYLVLGWWGNDNELFTSVSVQTPSGWVEDPSLYTQTWSGEMVMNASLPMYEFACHEGNYAMEGILGGARRIEADGGVPTLGPGIAAGLEIPPAE